MATFFTADTHFGHGGALGLYRRPFPGIAAMDAALVDAWNARVAPDDDIWHLGDFALTRAAHRPAELLAALHGRKHLITGNNDPDPVRALPGWTSVQDYAELTTDGARLVLCHYAFRTWNGMTRHTLNLHGHSHGRLPPVLRQFDVGVDARGFRPVTVGELLGR